VDYYEQYASAFRLVLILPTVVSEPKLFGLVPINKLIIGFVKACSFI